VDVILSQIETRVLGALIEKQITTPEYYPLSLNALTNACNQKSNREPVVSYDEDTVLLAMDGLREKKLGWVIKKADSRVLKYGHIFPEAFHLTPAEVAVVCVLMLRGPLTVGEIRACTGRLYGFQDLDEVEAAIQGLITNDQGTMLVRLPRQAGRKESRYAHLLSGEIEIEEGAEVQAEALVGPSSPVSAKIASLEEEVAALQEQVADLRQEFADFKKQFE
jgi:uncharacterized protein YceH (UPF0502 family)